MAEYMDSPVFADRYRFEPVGNDWDRGRSGFTHLVYDLKAKRPGVIKRAETISKQATEGLKNEVGALRALRDFGVPEVYDTNQAVYASKNYFYMVIEYIDGMRVERKLDSLNASERAEILTQLFRLLAQAHRRGIVNGDIDLKHLFWRRDKKQLVIIDWGNAQLNVDPKKKTNFAYDLARSAEIIFSLVTRQGHPPAAGSIALPDDSALAPGLAPLPVEFRNLCKWAPRTPSDGAHAPYTASELFEVSKRWFGVINKSTHPARKRTGLVLFLIFLVVAAIFLAVANFSWLSSFIYSLLPTSTATLTSIETSPSSVPSATLVIDETPSPTVTPTEISLVPTETTTPTPTIIPSPRTYTDTDKTFLFDNIVTFSSSPQRLCWRGANSPLVLKEREGFFRNEDDDWWLFSTGEQQAVDAGLQECLDDKSVEGMALNALVTHLDPQRENVVEGEFGFFLEDQAGHRKEYTLWMDKDGKMHLRVREDNNITEDDIISVVDLASLQRGGVPPIDYYTFPIQMFLEINNQGFDILYLQQTSSDAVQAIAIQPNQMKQYTVSKTFDSIIKIGLTGRGSKTLVKAWPLVFFGK